MKPKGKSCKNLIAFGFHLPNSAFLYHLPWYWWKIVSPTPTPTHSILVKYPFGLTASRLAGSATAAPLAEPTAAAAWCSTMFFHAYMFFIRDSSNSHAFANSTRANLPYSVGKSGFFWILLDSDFLVFVLCKIVLTKYGRYFLQHDCLQKRWRNN